MQYKGTQLVTHGAAAKAGVDVLSAQIAIELGPMGISSNVLAPGYIDGTEGMERLGHADQARTIPLGRLGTLKDMGDAAVYLFSAAGSYITGAVLVGENPFRMVFSPSYIQWTNEQYTVDGGEWRTAGQSISGAEYPSIDLLTGTTRSNVKL
jgi:peroxisomal 2,4-dienoyl-CoA reductase